ncbi:16S rRNA (cytidine(1402)-2'-O)-methyltransferase [Alicyclobacillus fodiniaquatilis]|uniref:Ribosomal RNA small subunit methyltransferase I n=1 Tax=Alicyclobacillus fodiniaquatilis TaxID=1661150 RepID=A0ABW4JEM0_9BACL
MNIIKSFADTGPKLYICSTPIGNLSDVSERLVTTLKAVDIVLCEDTRHTRKLLTHFDIHPPKVASYHQHNEQLRQAWMAEAWAQGQSIALVSDAGTPLLSDPGEVAVDTAIERGIPVIPIPGPSALLAALVGSGFPLQPFVYLGFLPRSLGAMETALQTYLPIPATLIMYEAPHRLVATLERISQLFGEKRAVLAKELTKKHETFIHGTLPELAQYVKDEAVRGEYVILLDNRGIRASEEVDPEAVWQQAVDLVLEKMAQGERHKTAVQAVALQLSVNRRDLYNATLS